jgi:DNA-binding MarR family transcriptional regulator
MEDPRWLTDEQQETWRKLVTVFTKLPAALDAQLQRDSSITHFGYVVLAALSETPGHRMRLSNLATLTNSSLSRLSHVMTRLEERGWVRRERDPHSRRSNVAILTPDGMAKVEECAPGHVLAVWSLVFEGLSQAETQRLDDVCTALIARLDPPGQ